MLFVKVKVNYSIGLNFLIYYLLYWAHLEMD